MIPILFPYTETGFNSNGIGRLSECVSCTVTQEMNGAFNCELVIPVTAKHFSEIVPGNYIYVTHDATHKPQPFYINDITGVENGCVTVRARHISDKLFNVYFGAFWANGTIKYSDFMGEIRSYVFTPCSFNFEASDNTWDGGLGEFGLRGVMNVWDYLYYTDNNSDEVFHGESGSVKHFVDGGFFIRDLWDVTYKQIRGSKNDVEITPVPLTTIRYGKNAKDIRIVTNADDYFNACVSYYYEYDESTSSEYFLFGNVYQKPETVGVEPTVIKLSDSSDWEGGRPSVTDLTNVARSVVNDDYEPVKKSVEITVAFDDTGYGNENYGDKQMQRLIIGDVVDFEYSPTNDVFNNLCVTKTVYDSLIEKYTSMSIGGLEKTYGQVIKSNF